jgi:hypothetical protein
MAKTLLEDFIARLNANVFLREFAFSSTELSVDGVGQVEVADHVVLLGNLALAFQLKERTQDASSAEQLEKWLANKVARKAVRQIRSTRDLISQFKGRELVNDRGHKVLLSESTLDGLVAVVVFRAPVVDDFHWLQFRESESAGFVHIIRDIDYFGVCQYLLTPVEIVDYLRFRQTVLQRYRPTPGTVTEAALVGQFMSTEEVSPPAQDYERVFLALREDPAEWDMSLITERLGDQVEYRVGDESETSHYTILRELALLSRSELREFKARFRLTLQAVQEDRFELPYRFAVPRTECGFLLLPLTKDMQPHAQRALQNLSLGSKHEMSVYKQVGVAVMKVDEYLDILWLYTEGDNQPNPELDRMLKEKYPFRRTSEQYKPRYWFDSDSLSKHRPRGTKE